MINERAKVILEFCFVKTPLEQWFKKEDEFDKQLRGLFLNDFKNAVNNKYDEWQDHPEECVALIMLLDQLSRNFYRNNPKAYEQDYRCRLIVNEAVDRGFLEDLDQDKIHFLLLPLIHSEDISDHIFGHQLVDTYLKDYIEYKKIKKAWNDHTVAIKKFGRYPHRNKLLNRKSTLQEEEFLKQPDSSW
tara:strand:- start:69 stop:632 length:564 start_codon:yes stop_codon:yes gene_type:complete